MAIRAEDAARLDFSDVAGAERIGAVPPGEVLREEFMVPLGLSGRALARELGIPSNRITEIVAGARAITAETALLLAERFGTTGEFWLNLQTAHNLEMARKRLLRPRVELGGASAKLQGHKKLTQIARDLKNHKSVAPVSVRELLRWFGAKYRGVHVNNVIRGALRQNDLHIEPDLNTQHIDSHMKFHTGVEIDEIEKQFYKNYRPLQQGCTLNRIEAAMLNKLYIERFCDCLVGWIDRNPRVTERELRAKAEALNQLGFDELENEDGAEVILLPEPPHRTGRLPAPENFIRQIPPDTSISAGASRSLRRRYEELKSRANG